MPLYVASHNLYVIYMGKIIKSVYFHELVLLIFIVIFKMFVLNNYIEYSLFTAAFSLLAFSIILYFIYGKVRDKNYLKPISIKIVIISLLVYFLIIYLLGFFLGFSYSLLDRNILKTLKNIFPYLLLFSSIEFSRYIILKQCTKKSQIIILTIEFMILNIIIGISGVGLVGFKKIFIVVSTLVLPIIANEALCTYLSYKISYVPSLIYRLVIELYMFVVPFTPNLGNYLNSVFSLILPFSVYFENRKALIYKEKYSAKSKKTIRNILMIVFISFLLGIIAITSGIFKYQLVAIVSESMEPTYYRGDAVIIEKKEAKDVKEGDILAFNLGTGIITHRVTKISNNNNVYTFVTKGDNNKTEDIYEIHNEHVIGTIKYIMKYAGYPTVIVNDLFEKR